LTRSCSRVPTAAAAAAAADGYEAGLTHVITQLIIFVDFVCPSLWNPEKLTGDF